MDDKLKRKDNIRIFLDVYNGHHETISSALHIVLRFSDVDYVVNSQDWVKNKEDVIIERLVVDSEVGKRMYPLHREAVLEKLGRCCWLAWGKDDLIFHNKPRRFNEDKEDIWTGHPSPRNVRVHNSLTGIHLAYAVVSDYEIEEYLKSLSRVFICELHNHTCA